MVELLISIVYILGDTMLLQTQNDRLVRWLTNSLYISLLSVTMLLTIIFKSEIKDALFCSILNSCPSRLQYDQRASLQALEDNILQNNLRAHNGQKVLIYSLARSGSSFLGEIFNRHDEVFYMYEPLQAEHVFWKVGVYPSYEYKSRALQLLRNFQSCEFSNYEDYFTFLSYPELSNPHFRLMSKVLSSPPFCDYYVSVNSTEEEYRKHCYKLHANMVMKSCASKKHIVIKELVHRFPFGSITGVLTLFQEESFRSIYLIRDPRAIVWSMYKIGWIGYHDNAFANSIGAASEKVCQMFINNYKAVNTYERFIQHKLLILRYEDLVSEPEDVVHSLYKFTNLKLEEDTIKWVIKNTHGQLDNMDTSKSFSVLLRNVSYSLNSWRKHLRFGQALTIQSLCGEEMKKFGYVLYDNWSDMNDMTISTFNNNINVPQTLRL